MKEYRQQHKQQNRPKKSELIIGIVNIIDGIKNGIALDKILVNNKVSEKNFSTLFEVGQSNNIPIQKVPLEKINALNIGEHDGAVAILSKVIYQDLQAVIDFIVEKGSTPLFLILDGITDIRNIGGISRSAYALGVDAIIIPDKGIGALNEDAILTSAGALKKITICRVKSLMKAVDDLHLNGIKVYASEMTAEKNLHAMDFATPCAIIMGGEEKGIFPPLMKICDDRFTIPMHNDFESLNVSVATGIILYEVQKQRNI